MYGHGNYDMVIDLCLAVVDENLDRHSVGDPPASKEHPPFISRLWLATRSPAAAPVLKRHRFDKRQYRHYAGGGR